MITFLRCYGLPLLFAVMLAVFNSGYVVAGIMPSDAAQFTTAYTMPICVVAWVQWIATHVAARRARCIVTSGVW
jgi:hypothetical protein